MGQLRIRWGWLARGVGVLAGGLVALQVLPGVLAPPEAPPLAADVGLPQVKAGGERAPRILREARLEPAPEPPRSPAPAPTGVSAASAEIGTTPRRHRDRDRSRRKAHVRPPRPAPPPAPAPPPPPPEPAPVAPAPAPPPAPEDGSLEFAPR